MISQEFEPFYRWFHSKVKVDGITGYVSTELLVDEKQEVKQEIPKSVEQPKEEPKGCAGSVGGSMLALGGLAAFFLLRRKKSSK